MSFMGPVPVFKTDKDITDWVKANNLCSICLDTPHFDAGSYACQSCWKGLGLDTNGANHGKTVETINHHHHKRGYCINCEEMKYMESPHWLCEHCRSL